MTPMTPYEQPVVEEGNRQCNEWKAKLEDAKDQIALFAAAYQPHRPGAYYDRTLEGSLNLSLVVQFDDEGPELIIRFPKPGRTAVHLMEEKVWNEATILNLLQHNSTIPIPKLIGWGMAAQSPQQLGPYLVQEFVEGVKLSELNPDPAGLDLIYEQLAEYTLQLARIQFWQIGAIRFSDPVHNGYNATAKPLTLNHNKLATGLAKGKVPGWESRSRALVSEYFKDMVIEHWTHMERQGNFAQDREEAKKKYKTRFMFEQLIQDFCIEDTGPFMPFRDEFKASDILVDPETLKVKAILDWEFTNAMPAQFSYDPPRWLVSPQPEVWLETRSLGEFKAEYEPKMDRFVRILERVEARTPGAIVPNEQPLSAKMRESWESSRFWFNVGIRNGFAIDAVYWEALHRPGNSVVDDMHGEMKRYADKCMSNLSKYQSGMWPKF